VLTTSTDLPAAEVAQAYKSLWRVERAFRTLKSTLGHLEKPSEWRRNVIL
jgi:IS4 transposase